MKQYVMIFLILMVLCSCGRQPIQKFNQIPENTWAFDHPESFDIDIKEPGNYRMILQLRYNQDYSYSNIWVGLTAKKPDGTSEITRFNIPLFDLKGRPFGSFAGKFYDRSYPAANVDEKNLFSLQFPTAGHYTLTLQHQMRNDKLIGISELGIRLIALK